MDINKFKDICKITIINIFIWFIVCTIITIVYVIRKPSQITLLLTILGTVIYILIRIIIKDVKDVIEKIK